jgi:beta-ureidopropionase
MNFSRLNDSDMEKHYITRRNFIQKTAVSSSLAAIVPGAIVAGEVSVKPEKEKLPREVWIACVSQMGLHADTPEHMVDQIFEILKEVRPYSPDIVCMPETFPFNNVEKQTTPQEKVEISDRVLKHFSEFSAQNNCYTICPVYTSRMGNVYNAAVVFDREGKRTGGYEKIHLTDYEINDGFKCGPLFQPVIATEFGRIGIQICFDIEWNDGWKMLRQQDAEIIFWPSAFAGGKCVNSKAWENKCVVASATCKNTAKLCDISGEVIDQTGIWNSNLFCAPVNLEKTFLHTWPYVQRFGEIREKYGRKVKITNFHEEEWSVIESQSPEILVKDILKEFDLKTHEELISFSEGLQVKSRE